MSKKVVAIAFSDIQIEDWPSYGMEKSRLEWHEKIFRTISSACERYRVPALFAGDLFDNPKALKNVVLHYFTLWYKEYFEDKGIPFYGISGNHDQCYPNRLKSISPNYLMTFADLYETFHCLDFKYIDHDQTKIRIHGIPYLTGEDGFKELFSAALSDKHPTYKNILLIHRDLWGAKEPNGYLRDEIKDELPENLMEWFGRFELVLSGHIHKPQVLTSNTYMLGATHQQRKSDKGNKMGYWVVYREGAELKVHFKRIDMPTFKYSDEPLPYDMAIPHPPKEVVDKAQEHNYEEFNPLKLALAYSKDQGLELGDPRTKLLRKYLSQSK